MISNSKLPRPKSLVDCPKFLPQHQFVGLPLQRFASQKESTHKQPFSRLLSALASRRVSKACSSLCRKSLHSEDLHKNSFDFTGYHGHMVIRTWANAVLLGMPSGCVARSLWRASSVV